MPFQSLFACWREREGLHLQPVLRGRLELPSRLAVQVDVPVSETSGLPTSAGEEVMKRLSRDWRVWAGLAGLGLVVLLLGPKPAAAHSFLGSLQRLLLAQSSDPPETDTPQPTLVSVAGPSSTGGLQLSDMTGRYEKTDLVIQNSTGPFVLKRTFRTSLGYWKQPQDYFVTQPQWWTNLTSNVQFMSYANDGITCVGSPLNPDCVRSPDYIVTDPDTGSFLNYYSNGNPQVPQQGFQIPVDAANQDKLYVNASNQDGGISSLNLFTP